MDSIDFEVEARMAEKVVTPGAGGAEAAADNIAADQSLWYVR